MLEIFDTPNWHQLTWFCEPYCGRPERNPWQTSKRGHGCLEGTSFVSKTLYYDKLIRTGLTLQHAKLGKLREKLQEASEDTPYITKDKLLQLIQERCGASVTYCMYTSRPLLCPAPCLCLANMPSCQCSGAVSRPEDAEQTCHALNDSGQVLLYQDKAYLRPAEVAEMVLQALPDTTKDLEDKLTILHRELQPLEEVKKDVDKNAHRLHACVKLNLLFLLTISALCVTSARFYAC